MEVEATDKVGGNSLMFEIFFYFIAFSAVVFAILSVISRDIFHCAVYLAMTLLSVSGIYFYLHAEFLGVVQILVYVGGIMTLFIFAIKLTAKIGDKSIQQVNTQFVPSALASLILFYLFCRIIGSHPWMRTQSLDTVISLNEVGKSLITFYALPFEFISLLLLAAMVGAIVIGKVKK